MGPLYKLQTTNFKYLIKHQIRLKLSCDFFEVC